MIMNREKTLEAFRLAVLASLDEAAKEVFGHLPLCGSNSQGAIDADLPALFQGIDAQTERLCERYGVVMVDYDPEEYARNNPLPPRQ